MSVVEKLSFLANSCGSCPKIHEDELQLGRTISCSVELASGTKIDKSVRTRSLEIKERRYFTMIHIIIGMSQSFNRIIECTNNNNKPDSFAAKGFGKSYLWGDCSKEQNMQTVGR